MTDVLLDAVLDDLVEIDLARVMHVRTEAGVKKYGLPIGAVIHAKVGQSFASVAASMVKTPDALKGMTHHPVKGDVFYTITKGKPESYTEYTFDGEVWHYETPKTHTAKTASQVAMQSAVAQWLANDKGDIWAQTDHPLDEWEWQLMAGQDDAKDLQETSGDASAPDVLPTPTLQKIHDQVKPVNPKMPIAANLHADFPEPSLSTDESWALHEVYGYAWGYKLLNPYLFHNKQKWDSNAHDYVDVTPPEQHTAEKAIAALDTAFAKAKPTDHAVVVYRRSGAEIIGGEGAKADLTGETIENKGYTSTATSITTHGYGYESKPILWKIVLPEGTKALPGNDFENEVLLNRGAHFKVISDEKAGKDRVLTVQYEPTGSATRQYHPDPEQGSALKGKHEEPGVKQPQAQTMHPYGTPKDLINKPVASVQELDQAPTGTHVLHETGFGGGDEYEKGGDGEWHLQGSVNNAHFSSGDFGYVIGDKEDTPLKYVANEDHPPKPVGVHYAPDPHDPYYKMTGEPVFKGQALGTSFTEDTVHGTGGGVFVKDSKGWTQFPHEYISDYGMTGKSGTFMAPGAEPAQPKPLAQVLAESVDFLKQYGTAKDAQIGTKYTPPGSVDTFYTKTGENEWTMSPPPPPGSAMAKAVPDSDLDKWKAYVKTHPEEYANPASASNPVPESKPETNPAKHKVQGGYSSVEGNEGTPDFPVYDYSGVEKNIGPVPHGVNQVREYVGSWASKINDDLRHDSSSLKGYQADALRRMDSAFTPVKHGMTVFRTVPTSSVGVDTKYGSNPTQKVYDELRGLIGSTIVDKGYLSTSYDTQGSTVAGSPYFSLRIHVPEGTPAIFAQPHSGFDEEHEVILPRGLPLKVNDISWHESAYGETMLIADVTALPKKLKHHATHAPKALDAEHLPKTAKAYSTLEALPTGTTIRKKGDLAVAWEKNNNGNWNAVGYNYGTQTTEMVTSGGDTWLVTPPSKPAMTPKYGEGNAPGPDFVTKVEFQEAPIGAVFHSSGTGFDWTKVEMGEKGGKWAMADHPEEPPAGIAVVKVGGPGKLTYPAGEHLPTPGHVPTAEMVDAPLGTTWHAPGGDWIKVGLPSLWKKKDPNSATEVKDGLNGYQGQLEKPHFEAEPEHKATHSLLGKKPPNAVQAFEGLTPSQKKEALHIAQAAKEKLTAAEEGARVLDSGWQVEWERMGGPGAGWEYLGDDIETIKWALDDQGKHKQIESVSVALWIAAKNQKEGWAYSLDGVALTTQPGSTAWANAVVYATDFGGTVTDQNGVQWVKVQGGWKVYGDAPSKIISSKDLIERMTSG